MKKTLEFKTFKQVYAQTRVAKILQKTSWTFIIFYTDNRIYYIIIRREGFKDMDMNLPKRERESPMAWGERDYYISFLYIINCA